MTALKGGDVVAVAVLRTTLAGLSNAEAIDPGVDGRPVRAGLFGDEERRRLSADDVVSIVAGERDELQAAAALLDEAGRAVEAAGCRARASVLDHYLAA